MKFTLACVLTLVVLSTNGASSSPVQDVQDFCKHKLHTNGRQIEGGSCSSTVQGDLPSVEHMVSTIITSPPDHKVLKANKPFHVEVIVSNLETGHFSDPEKAYYAKPQQLGSHGLIQGHLHVTIQKINTHQPPDPRKFAFFKGLEDKAQSGRLEADVPGLPAGSYRICTLSSSFTHQPVIMPVAKRGAQDDCIRVKVRKSGEEEEVGKQEDTTGKSKKEKVGKQKDTTGKSKEEVGKQKDTTSIQKDQVGKQDDLKIIDYTAGSK